MSLRALASHWVQSPLWDGFFLFAGLWAPLLSVSIYGALWLLAGSPAVSELPGHDLPALAAIYLPLSILHRITTPYAVLGTPILRDEIRQNPARYLYVPLAIFAGTVALSLCFVFHGAFAFMGSPYGQLWAFFLLAYVMILWERWHFCAQEFGVLSIYRIRAKQTAPEDKRFDRLYTVVLMLGVNMVLYACLGFSDVRDVLLHGTPLGSYRGELLGSVARIAFAIGMVVTAVALIREYRHPQRSLPKLLFYGLIGGHTLLLYTFPKALGLFFLSYAFHHWMVAIGLFGRVTVNSYSEPTPAAKAARFVLRVGPVLALAWLWYLFFAPLYKAGNLAPVPDTQWFAGATLSAKVIAGVVIGVFFSLEFLHYYYDRCFYSFSNPAVRKRVGPLLFGPAPAKDTAASTARAGAQAV
jgi:hypothetical protein